MSASVIIGFSGHRDRTASPERLRAIHAQYPGALWLHGGAEGFDSQVDAFAKANGIPVEALPPNYQKYGQKYAPLLRNKLIVDRCDFLVALYDGRKTGGTAHTVGYANLYKKFRLNLYDGEPNGGQLCLIP